MQRLGFMLGAALAFLVPATSVAAEEAERRLTVAPEARTLAVGAFGPAVDTGAYGARIAFAYGLSHALELGGELTYVTRPNARLDGMVAELGESLSVYTDLHAAEAAVTGRYLLVSPLARLLPLAELRAGVVQRWLRQPQAFDAEGVFVADLDAAADLIPVAGVRAGAAFRWTDNLQLAAVVSADVGTDDHRAFGAALELSWQTFSIF